MEPPMLFMNSPPGPRFLRVRQFFRQNSSHLPSFTGWLSLTAKDRAGQKALRICVLLEQRLSLGKVRYEPDDTR